MMDEINDTNDMDQMKALGQNVRDLREGLGLSLGQLAEKCGVSKVILSKIEKGDANPTIGTLWKIARGFGIPYTRLLAPEKKSTDVLHKSAVHVDTSEDGTYKSYIYYRTGPKCPFDWITVDLAPSAVRNSEGHTRGAMEYIYVLSGSLELHYGDEIVTLIKDDSFCMDASLPHSYINRGTDWLSLVTLICYDESENHK